MTLSTTTPQAPATDDPALTLWATNFAAMLAAQEVTDRYDAAVFNPLYERKRAFERDKGVEDLFPAHPEVKAVHEADGFRHAIPADIYDRQQELCEQFVDAQSEVMNTPAPHLSALRWKLDQILVLEHSDDSDGGSTPSWTRKYVAQTFDDIARLLPKGA